LITVDAPLGSTPLFVRAGAALFLAAPGRNAQETLRGPLALEITPPPRGVRGSGSLFLDDGESEGDQRLVLDATVAGSGDRLLVQLDRVNDSFRPEQRDLEVRVPATYRYAIHGGVRFPLVSRELADEDRRRIVAAARAPLDAREIVFE
jgi:hypothetical protein